MTRLIFAPLNFYILPSVSEIHYSVSGDQSTEFFRNKSLIIKHKRYGNH